MLEVQVLPPDLVLERSPAPVAWPQATLERIEEHWRVHCQRHPKAFDGTVYTLVAQRGRRLWIRAVPYRAWVAQRLEPALFGNSPLRPVAVSGLVELAEGVLVGRRSQAVLQDPGRWELVPSGGLDEQAVRSDGRLEAEAQLAIEFKEELNLHWRDVRSVTPLARVDDPSSGVVDLGFRVELELSFAEVCERFRARSSQEYSDLRCVAKGHLEDFFRWSSQDCVAVSQALLEVAGLLSPRPEGESVRAMRDPR